MMCAGARRVDVVDHRRERRALAAAGRAGDEDEAALFLGDLLEDRRQAELVDGRDLRRDDAQDHADRAALLEDVAAEAAEAGDAVGEVDFLVSSELLACSGGSIAAPSRRCRRGRAASLRTRRPASRGPASSGSCRP